MNAFVIGYLAVGVVTIGWMLIATRTAPELLAPGTDLRHAHPDCPGEWLEEPSAGLIRCNRCAAVVVLTPETSLAASQENDLGLVLHDAANEGAALRLREKAGW